jgi:hypothetical protein
MPLVLCGSGGRFKPPGALSRGSVSPWKVTARNVQALVDDLYRLSLAHEASNAVNDSG